MEEYHGDFYRTLFECLSESGRLTATQTAQKCHLPLRQVKIGLSGLIQLRLITHHTILDSPSTYSANLTAAYNIIRVGKLIEAARGSHGDLAAEILVTFCELGFATISEVRDRLLSRPDISEENNAHAVEHQIQELHEGQYLVNVRTAHFSEGHDTRRDYELIGTTAVQLAKLSGTKAKQEHAERVEAGYRDLVSTKRSESGYTNDKFLTTFNKAASNGVNGTTNLANGHNKAISVLLQPNLHKVVSIAQGACVTDVATKTFGKTAGTVLRCAIQQVADSDVWTKQPPEYIHLIDTQGLRDDVNAERQSQIESDSRNAKLKVNGYTTTVEEDDLRTTDVERQLALLTEGPFRFLSSGAAGSSFFIDKDMLDFYLRREEILRVMDSKVEPPAPRILRILIDKGKLEEKTLQEIGLLGAKELRQCLSMLKQMGYLDLQEVPRNPQRQPNQTVFLWFHDAKRVSNLIVENTYTTIARLMELLKLERQNLASTLAKVEREDVKGKEEQMLGPAEYIVLMRHRRLEEWVWEEIHRLDSTVAILRDS